MDQKHPIIEIDRKVVGLIADQLYRNLGTGASELCKTLDGLLDGSFETVTLKLGETPQALQDASICCGDLTIRLRTRKVTRGEEVLSLTPKEYDILVFLAQNRGQVFTKEEIYQAVWAEDYLLDNSNVMAFIRKLRKKIEPNPDSPQYILTIWGIGYKFNDEL